MDTGAVIVVGAVGIGVLGTWVAAARGGVRELVRARRVRRRARRATATALDAALTDPTFEPGRIRDDVAALLRLAEQGDADAMRWTPELGAWAAERRMFLGPGFRVDPRLRVDVLQVVNREGEDEDRVVVRVRWRARYEQGGHERLDERWMLGRRAGVWLLLAAHGDPRATELLESPLIAAPDVDEAELRRAGLGEVAALDAHASVPPTGGERTLLEAAALDARFMPDLIGATLARLVDDWSQATRGQPAALNRRVLAAAAEPMLRVGDGRRVLDDALLERWSCMAIDRDAVPPRITIELTVSAAQQIRYTDAPTRGSARARRTLRVYWTLSVIGPPEDPWRLVASAEAPESHAWQPLGLPIQVRWGRR